MLRKNYSRYASVEEKKNVKNAIKFGLLTITAIIALIFFGIPILGRFAGFVADISKSDKPISKNDSTPPAPPQINNLPEFTNQTSIKIEGKSEEGATIKLSFNGNEEEVVANNEGGFSTEFNLQKGVNMLDAIAVDTSGNESLRTKTFSITFDNEKPDLEVESPAEGTQFFGSHERQLTMSGKTDVDSQLTINGRFVTVDGDGKFEFTSTLGEGENKFNLKSTDLAGNMTEKDFVVTFTP